MLGLKVCLFRTKMIYKLITVLVLLMSNHIASARDFEGAYAVYGAGADSCQQYIGSMKNAGKEQDYFIDWMIGYLSAFNVIMPNTHNILGETDFDAAQLWLQRHCEKYPKEPFITSMIKLTEVLYSMRHQSGLKKQSAPEVDINAATAR